MNTQKTPLNEMKKEWNMSPKWKEEIRGKGKVAFSKGGELRKNDALILSLDSAIAKAPGFHAQEKPNLHPSDVSTSSSSHCTSRDLPI